MAGINRVLIVGNVGRDPEIKRLNNGNSIASFSIATSDKWRDKQSGEMKESTEWHNIVVFNDNIVKIVEQYVKKGSQVGVEGKIKTRKWKDQSGADRYSTEIVLENFGGQLYLLGGGQRDNNERSSSGQGSSVGSGNSNAKPQPATIDDDSEIPF